MTLNKNATVVSGGDKNACDKAESEVTMEDLSLANNTTSPTITTNCITNKAEQTLVKTWFKDADGEVGKQGGGQLSVGTIKSKETTLADHIKEAVQAGPNSFYVACPTKFPADMGVLSRKAVNYRRDLIGYEDPNEEQSFITRTKDKLMYEDGQPGLWLLDHDYSDFAPHNFKDPADLFKLLSELFPAVFNEGVSHGYYFSSSSFIYDGEEQVTDAKGFHMLFAAQDSSDIPRFRDALFDRLWLLGYGFIFITKDGKHLPRTLFDKVAVQAYQPIFTSVACCDGLEQRRPDPVIKPGGYLNTLALPSLTVEEFDEVARLKEEAKEKIDDRIKDVRRDYVKAESKSLVKRAKKRGEIIPLGRAKRIVESRIGGTLTGSDMLEFDDAGAIPVEVVMEDPDMWNMKTLADPLEPDYGGGTGKAIFYANEDNGEPVVFSHAHGGRVFFLRHDLASVCRAVEKLSDTDLQDEWIRLGLKAEIRADEQDVFLKKVADRTGSTKTALTQTLKTEVRQAVSKRKRKRYDLPEFLARRLLTQSYHRGRHLMQTADRQFWKYTGTHWTRVKDPVLEGELQLVAKQSWAILKSEAGWGNELSLSSLVSESMKVLGRDQVKPGDPLRLMAAQPAVINCTNGEVWLTDKGAELRQHKPESYLTSCSNITYDPDADAPIYMDLVEKTFCYPGGAPLPDMHSMARHVDEILGYMAQPSRFLKQFFMWVGDGDNGKTMLMRLLTEIIGIDAVMWERLDKIESDQHKRANLIGKKAVIDDDADRNFKLPDGFLKRIGERKAMTGRHLYKDEISFLVEVAPVILANHFPTSRDLSRGMRTRAQVIKFPRTFKKFSEVEAGHPDAQRPDLWKKVFDTEMPGVLNLLIDGYYRVAERGEFDTPPSCDAAFDEWFAVSNSVMRFASECLVKAGADDFVWLGDLYEAYSGKWAEDEHIQHRFLVAKNKFRQNLEDAGFSVRRTTGGNYAVFGVKPAAGWGPVIQRKPFGMLKEYQGPQPVPPS